MKPSHSRYDVTIVGGGPTGCVSAVAFAKRGARVLLVEANPRAASRFAGEWIHPPGAAALESLGMAPLQEASRHDPCRGFALFPDDGSGPIELPYADGHWGVSCEHHKLVDELRASAESTACVEYMPRTRMLGIQGHQVELCYDKGSRFTISSDRIIGADGRNSVVRQHLGLADNSCLMSYMAGIELRDIELPIEGFGYVILGAPGPILLYRTSPTIVRAVIDLPLAYSSLRRDPKRLWEVFGALFPTQALQHAFHDALRHRRIAWAAARFQPRSVYGRGHIALVGDAVGHFHPLTASGMTIGFLDAVSVAQHRHIEDYQRQREAASYISELLASALYQVMTREDRSAEAMRSAMCRILRKYPEERVRTMQILAGQERRPTQFGSVFARVAQEAVHQAFSATATWSPWRQLPTTLGSFAPWAQWPLASVLPRTLRKACRPESTPVDPIRGLKPKRYTRSASSSATIDPLPTISQRELDGDFSVCEHQHAERVADAMAQSVEAMRALRSEASPACSQYMAFSLSVGLANAKHFDPALHRAMQKAIGDWDPLQHDRDHDLAEVLHTPERLSLLVYRLSTLLAMLPNAEKAPLVRINTWLQQILQHQSPTGLFSMHPQEQQGSSAGGSKKNHSAKRCKPISLAQQDIEATRLACAALVACQKSLPGLRMREIAKVLERLLNALRYSQSSQGCWVVEGQESVYCTALAIQTLLMAGMSPADATLRRASRWLAARQKDDGYWVDAIGTRDPRVRSSEVLNALLGVRSSYWGTILRAAQVLLDDVATQQQPSSTDVPLLGALVPALSAYGARLHTRLTLFPDAVSSDSQQESDRAFCEAMLAKVSRTFVRPIEMLPDPLRTAVTCGYLLCRIADTIEDLPELEPQRDVLFAAFLQCLSDSEISQSVARLKDAFAHDPDARDDVQLAASTERVIRVFRRLPASMQAAVTPWVAEMTRGMQLYSHRQANAEGLINLHSLTDLERYCYYVAGTVGHMLTELFIAAIPDLSAERVSALRQHAEAFGVGLQFVNILKDITDDYARQWLFVPRDLYVAQGLAAADLFDEAHRSSAHRAVVPMFDRARLLLDQAFRYCLAIPADQQGIRLFCLLPLWMAARTLVHARGHDAMFIADQPVKISRSEVEDIIVDCASTYDNDTLLKANYSKLWQSFQTDQSDAVASSARDPKSLTNGQSRSASSSSVLEV